MNEGEGSVCQGGKMGEGEVGKRECEGDEECLEKQVGPLGGFQNLFEVCVCVDTHRL